MRTPGVRSRPTAHRCLGRVTIISHSRWAVCALPNARIRSCLPAFNGAAALPGRRDGLAQFLVSCPGKPCALATGRPPRRSRNRGPEDSKYRAAWELHFRSGLVGGGENGPDRASFARSTHSLRITTAATTAFRSQSTPTLSEAYHAQGQIAWPRYRPSDDGNRQRTACGSVALCRRRAATPYSGNRFAADVLRKHPLSAEDDRAEQDMRRAEVERLWTWAGCVGPGCRGSRGRLPGRLLESRSGGDSPVGNRCAAAPLANGIARGTRRVGGRAGDGRAGGTWEQAEYLSTLGKKRRRKIPVHINIDTGMGAAVSLSSRPI